MVCDLSHVQFPAEICRGCNKIVSECSCVSVQCLWCLDGETRECTHCGGDGVMQPDNVAVVPDQTAHRIRNYLRHTPELLKEEYNTDDPDTGLDGMCYPLSEAYYHATGKTLDVYCLSWEDVDESYDGTHWYLRDPNSKTFIDLGIPFESGVELPPFETGRCRAFITGDSPSERTKVVLDSLSIDY